MKNVFYFTAEWCGPCKKTRPVVEDMKKEGFEFQMIDVDYEQSLVERFKVNSIPTFILLEDGRELSRVTGAKTRAELENFINYEKTIQENI
jgi:thioredoxin-like negative regulator of GroEL